MNNALVLSVFPGIDLFGRAFENAGFCVVRGPDLITGGDIRTFHPPSQRFDGVIGGPPCQDYSKLNRSPGPYSDEMLSEYCRVVSEAGAEWFLFENVVAAPLFTIPGYTEQRFALDLAWFSGFSRRRDFVFGSKGGVLLDPTNDVRRHSKGFCVTGSDARSFRACCDIQGLPPEFDLPFFSLEGKKTAVANAVPMALGLYLAGLVSKTVYGQCVPENPPGDTRLCRCGCGRVVVGGASYHGASCRKRAQRARERATNRDRLGGNDVTVRMRAV